jgi:uncharacterized membrane protein YcaP (DUF421 family)
MSVIEWFQKLLGLQMQPHELTLWHVAARSVVVFIAALVMVRLGAKRFLAGKTAFDMILAFTLGSMLSRAINGSASFFPTLVGGFVLVAFHRLLAALAFHFRGFGILIKGKDDKLIEQGKIRHQGLRKNHFSEDDLLEELRLEGCEKPEEVRCARLERSGELSVIRAK